MKTENIPAEIKSKSLKDARDEIDKILAKLEGNHLNLDDTHLQYKRLMQLNKHVQNLFRKKLQDLSSDKK